MSLRPFFGYYGGKWRAAPRYPAPTTGVVIEPFAGSAGYSVRHPDRQVMLFDLDEKVIGTWQYLIKVSADEIRALPLMGPTDHVANLAVPQEARWLIGWWLNKGMTAPCNVPSRWMREPLPGRVETYWGAGVRERIARQVEHIRHWQAFHTSYVDAPDVPATWFIDPPYSGPPGRRYAHSTVDYRALGEWCRTRTGQVIVCENVGAGWLPFEPFMAAKATAGRGRTGVSNEAIWTGVTVNCLAATVHDGHSHHCTIEPSPHPVDITHMAPCGSALHRWTDPEPATPATPAPTKIVCGDGPEITHPAAIKLANLAGDSWWTTQLATEGNAITLTLTRGDDHGSVLWGRDDDGPWRFVSCKIAGRKFGYRAIPARLAQLQQAIEPTEAATPAPLVATPSTAPVAAPPAAPAPVGGVMPSGTLASFMAAPAGAQVVQGNTPWANAYAETLREVIHHAGKTSDRNLQIHLGPSELGVECDRQVAGKFAGLPEINNVVDPWPSILGTAGHAWLADAFKRDNDRRGLRWVPEHRVTPHPDHSGTADLYDGAEQAVVDWKILSHDKIDALATKGPSRQYRVQLKLYGLGYRNLGLPVRRVALVALPRTKASLKTMYVWDHELTPADDREIEEVWQQTGVRRSYGDGIVSGQITLMDVPSTPDADTCYFCPFYRPQAADDGGGGCPGTKQR